MARRPFDRSMNAAAAFLLAISLSVSAPVTCCAAGSQPASAAAAADDAAASNPLYRAWKGQEGKTVHFMRAEVISGGAPVPGNGRGPAATSTVTCTLGEFTADHAVVRIASGADGKEVDTLTIPRRFPPNDKSSPLLVGPETLKIGDKTYACTKYRYTSSSKAEIGRDPQGLRADVTVWVAAEVPGGIVRREISLTIRATYEITDTLAEK